VQFDEDTKQTAKALVVGLVEESAQRVRPDQVAALRSYYEAKGGLYRQLAARILYSRRTLRREDGLAWSLRDLHKDILSRAPSAESRQQFENWFSQRDKMLRGVSARLWDLAEQRGPPPVSTPIVAQTVEIPHELLVKYMSVPLSAEADPAKRTKGNLLAIEVMSSGRPIGSAEREILAGYTGWGGLSIENVASALPPKWTPNSDALIHEYYTPPMLCLSLARVLRKYVEAIERVKGTVRALEPSAGIGRFVNGLSFKGYKAVRWTAVEYSPISAAILRAMRPDIRVVEGSFERFVAAEESALTGNIDLVVANPPYGERGASFNDDPNRNYRERKAYVYFLRRCLDLLAPSGIGVFLIPYGFLTGQSAEYLSLRKRVLLRHHLMAAFRLPSSLFPGANIVTDLLLFRSRGGELTEVAGEDSAIVEGRYFELFPAHILGQELRSDKGAKDE
jgi:hypothetical protein